MHLSQNPFCCLCASSRKDESLTQISSEKGQREHLEALFDQYIIPILLLSKDDKLCVCDTCKTRLLDWDLFINSCKSTQERLKDSLSTCNQSVSTCNQSELPTSTKRQGDSASENTVSLVSEPSPPKKKKSSNYCIAPWCNKGNYQGVSLFRLPRERERALLWLTEAKRSDLENMKTLRSLYLCANHFTPDMFTNNARNQLVKTAVPKVFPKAPYSNKIALKAAASQIFPTQFQGVQLKSILPKITLPNRASPTSYKKIVMKAVPKPKVPTTLNPIVPRLSSQTTKETLPVSEDQTSSLLFRAQSPLPTSLENVIPINSHPPLSHNDMHADPQNDNFDIFLSASTFTRDPYNSNSQHSVVTLSSSLSSGSSALEPSLSQAERTAPMTKGRSSILRTKDQKEYLEEIESCFAFNSSTLMLGETDSYKIVGSQDFLLTHVSDNIDEQSFSLRSDDSVHPSDSSTHSVSSESNPILNQNDELNSPHIGIFDLPSEDIQGTESSFINNIENLDELMDLDKYFEGR